MLSSLVTSVLTSELSANTMITEANGRQLIHSNSTSIPVGLTTNDKALTDGAAAAAAEGDSVVVWSGSTRIDSAAAKLRKQKELFTW